MAGLGIVGSRVSDESCRQTTSKNVSHVLERELLEGLPLVRSGP